MKKPSTSLFDIHDSISCGSIYKKPVQRRAGFTLIEVILVVVITLILLGVSLPHFAHTLKGSQLRSAARTINRMARYARGTAIMREQTITVVIDGDTMQIYLGGSAQSTTNSADGELDQDVLKRLGYIEGDGSSENLGIEKEIHRYLPDNIEVADFEKDWFDDEPRYENIYVINYYSDGQSDWFKLELAGHYGMRVEIESDPVSGKLRSELKQ